MSVGFLSENNNNNTLDGFDDLPPINLGIGINYVGETAPELSRT